MVAGTLHGSMQTVWKHAHGMVACKLYVGMHTAWNNAHCMVAYKLHVGMHTAWKHAQGSQSSLICRGKITGVKIFTTGPVIAFE
jgi:hypothetical protein